MRRAGDWSYRRSRVNLKTMKYHTGYEANDVEALPRIPIDKQQDSRKYRLPRPQKKYEKNWPPD